MNTTLDLPPVVGRHPTLGYSEPRLGVGIPKFDDFRCALKRTSCGFSSGDRRQLPLKFLALGSQPVLLFAASGFVRDGHLQVSCLHQGL